MEQLIRENPHSEHYDEVQYRRGEYFFTRRRYRDAETAYSAVVNLKTASSYYELALYKLGWTFYKQDLYDEALDKYMAELRYQDAAKTYQAFVALYPLHRDAPQFSMRVIETFTKGGFPKLVLESKREFASKYGLQGEYWKHFKPEESPQVLAYVKTNLKDLATHYHAQYQNAQEPSEKLANYNEARRWYGDYLDNSRAS